MIRIPRTIGCALIVGVGLLLAPPTGSVEAWAQADTVAQAEQERTLRDLRETIEESYRVLPVRDGILLIPRVGEPDVQSIELSNGDIAIDGQVVTGAELRRALGEDADAVLRLSYLDVTTRRVLFGIGEPPGVAAADTATGEVVAADTAAAEEPEDRPRAVRSEGDRVRMGGSVVVREDEHVEGDVVAVGGSVRILGSVEGDVSAIGGSVRLGPGAVVDGDVVAVGGRIHRSPGAVVHGSIEETSWAVPEIGGVRGAPDFDAPFEGVGGFVATVAWIVFLGLLTALAYLVARRPVERMEYRVGTSGWKAAAIGLAAQILFFPVLILTIVVLAISIIGIPLLIAIPFALLALMVGVLVGFTAVAKRLGREAEARFGWDHASPYLSIMVGVGLIMAVPFFGAALGIAGGPLSVFAMVLGAVGFVIQYAAWTVGLGVLLMTRFGTRYSWSEEGGTTPAPPPAPEASPPAPETTPPPPPSSGEADRSRGQEEEEPRAET
ncbi:MAG: sulfite exporter TauE/SafE family protein [Gemmatimonadota bacterium]|nr:sulfite exporter TauE/SafE family protein [Gemmatimonadota bacterium]